MGTTGQLFSDIDHMDAGLFASHLAEDATLRFGNAPAIQGRDSIEEAIAGFFSTIGGLRHRVIEEWNAEGTTIVEVEVTYTRLDGGVVTLPAVIILRHADAAEGVADYRIFVDQSPLYA